MVPRILYLHPKTYKRLIRLRKQAERDGAYRVAKRLQEVSRGFSQTTTPDSSRVAAQLNQRAAGA